MIDELVNSGRIVDIMLLVLVVETAILAVYRQRTRRGIPIASLVANFGAGGSIVLALRAVLADQPAAIIAACLVASLGFHVADLALRWSRGPARDAAPAER
jgi:uncharacterized membrane protein YjjB (DUF3815 family)